VVEPKRWSTLSHVVPPLAFLLDASQYREGWCVELLRSLVERWQAVVRETVVQVPVALLDVGSAPVFLPDLDDKILQESILEILAGRDDLVVIPVVEPVAELEFLRELSETSLSCGLQMGVLQLLASFFELSGSQDSSGGRRFGQRFILLFLLLFLLARFSSLW